MGYSCRYITYDDFDVFTLRNYTLKIDNQCNDVIRVKSELLFVQNTRGV